MRASSRRTLLHKDDAVRLVACQLLQARQNVLGAVVQVVRDHDFARARLKQGQDRVASDVAIAATDEDALSLHGGERRQGVRLNK